MIVHRTVMVSGFEAIYVPAEELAKIPPGARIEIATLRPGDVVRQVDAGAGGFILVVERAEKDPVEVEIVFLSEEGA